jgi:hypothetical protein
MADTVGRQFLHRYDSQVPQIELVMTLQILANENGAVARDSKLTIGIITFPIPFDDDRALDKRVT